MKTFKTHKQLESKEIIFEPGNATRYHLVLTRVEEQLFSVMDMNDRKVVFFHPHHSSEKTLAFHLSHYGYSLGDAKPMAEYILKAIQQNAYITYKAVDDRSSLEYKTIWFADIPANWNYNLEMCGVDGHRVMEQGVIWE
jgi:hypothetical protein